MAGKSNKAKSKGRSLKPNVANSSESEAKPVDSSLTSKDIADSVKSPTVEANGAREEIGKAVEEDKTVNGNAEGTTASAKKQAEGEFLFMV